MNLVADESVDGAIVRRLRNDGHAVESIAERDSGLADDGVLATANALGRVLITSDKDFGELVYRLGLAHAGVVLLRLAGLPSARRAEIVSEVVRNREAELPDAFTVIEPDAVRIRRPPGNTSQ